MEMNMETSIPGGFSKTYKEARSKFLTAAHARGARLEEYVIPGRLGLFDETLATDVAWIGREDADKLLIITSGIHGVEGYCGSGCQIAMLNDDSLFARAKELDIAIALVHAVNPHGFSYGRRVNEDNVDVNRNFIPFGERVPTNPDYHELAPLLLPASWHRASGTWAKMPMGRRCFAGSTMRRTGCSTADASPHGRTRRSGTSCARLQPTRRRSDGSICTPASGRAAIARKYSSGTTTSFRWPRPGGAAT
jgi:hypothetical protein